MHKTAVSRWREAIYSGELPLEQREALKAHMGATPERYRQGLLKGDLANAAKRKYSILHTENAAREVLDSVRNKAFDSLTKNPEIFQDASLAFQGSNTHPVLKRIALSPTMDSINASGAVLKSKSTPIMERLRAVKSLFNPEVRKDFNSFIRHHEISEMQHKPTRNAATPSFMVAPEGRGRLTPTQRFRAASTGLLGGVADQVMGPNLTDLVAEMQPGLKEMNVRSVPKIVAQISGRGAIGPSRGHHLSPGVVLEELRSSRMQSPEMQRLQSVMRSQSGEYGRGVDSSKMVVPSPKSRGYRDLVAKLQSTADAGYAPVDATVNKWFGRGGKLVSFAEANSPKLKGVFEQLRNLKV